MERHYEKNKKSRLIEKIREKKQMRVIMFGALVFIALAFIIILEKVAKVVLGSEGLNLRLLDLPISFISASYIIIVFSMGVLSKDRRLTPKIYNQYILQGVLSFVAILMSAIITSKYGLNTVREIVLAVTIFHGIYLFKLVTKERIISGLFMLPMIILHVSMLYVGLLI